MPPGNRHPLWALAFRPFFLAAATSALVLITIWTSVLAGWVAPPGSLPPVLWHAHEMTFGFVAAVIAGFLLTAVQNWTGTPGVRGRPLQLLVALWFAGRLALALAPHPSWGVAALDLSFLPAVALALLPYLLRDPELKAERALLVILAVLFTGNLLVHLESLGVTRSTAYRGIHLALGALLALVVFIGGRVIPFFTESSIARAQPRTRPAVEIASQLTIWLFIAFQFAAPGTAPAAAAAWMAATAQLLRLLGWGWRVRRVRRVPLIWVLHLAYLWIAAGLALTGGADLGWIARSPATHALTVGGLGLVIFGMIARVSLGHTGRRLHPRAPTVAGFHLLNAAAILRVFGPLLFPAAAREFQLASGTLWIGAFALFLRIYAPILLQPRADGGPG